MAITTVTWPSRPRHRWRLTAVEALATSLSNRRLAVATTRRRRLTIVTSAFSLSTTGPTQATASMPLPLASRAIAV